MIHDTQQLLSEIAGQQNVIQGLLQERGQALVDRDMLPADLHGRCKEILQWEQSGVLTGNYLKQYASRKPYSQYPAALELAKADTFMELLEFVTARHSKDLLEAVDPVGRELIWTGNKPNIFIPGTCIRSYTEFSKAEAAAEKNWAEGEPLVRLSDVRKALIEAE